MNCFFCMYQFAWTPHSLTRPQFILTKRCSVNSGYCWWCTLEKLQSYRLILYSLSAARVVYAVRLMCLLMNSGHFSHPWIKCTLLVCVWCQLWHVRIFDSDTSVILGSLEFSIVHVNAITLRVRFPNFYFLQKWLPRCHCNRWYWSLSSTLLPRCSQFHSNNTLGLLLWCAQFMLNISACACALVSGLKVMTSLCALLQFLLLWSIVCVY